MGPASASGGIRQGPQGHRRGNWRDGWGRFWWGRRWRRVQRYRHPPPGLTHSLPAGTDV